MTVVLGALPALAGVSLGFLIALRLDKWVKEGR